MHTDHIFKFKTDITNVKISKKLNNPFGSKIPEIGKVAASEFQEYIASESVNWMHDFNSHKGKMFGVLVVKKNAGNIFYLGTISGKLLGSIACSKFVPSIIENAADDFINNGMKELAEIGNRIKTARNEAEILNYTVKRKAKSMELQQKLFESYQILNVLGIPKNLLEIFKTSKQGNPPSAAGECAAPKLLQYAIKHDLKPIALAEFWWGMSPKNQNIRHKGFYPACKSRCRPIIEYMLNDAELFTQANNDQELIS